MITNTHKKGFIFLEAVASIAILGGILLPLLMLQGTVLIRVQKDKAFVERSLILKKQFYNSAMNPDKEQQKNFEKTIINPELKIEYKTEAPKEGSLFARFKGLMIKSVKGSWGNGSQAKTELLFSQLDFDPEQGETNE